MDGSVAREGSTGSALLWMLGVSMLVFWVPVAGPVFAGFVGGLKAGGTGPAVVASILPAIMVATLVFLLGTTVTLPVVGALVGAGTLLVMLFQSLPLVAGAALGGALAE